jgi:hypothetical protein
VLVLDFETGLMHASVFLDEREVSGREGGKCYHETKKGGRESIMFAQTGDEGLVATPSLHSHRLRPLAGRQ